MEPTLNIRILKVTKTLDLENFEYSEDHYLPTECVVKEPRFVVPMVARTYRFRQWFASDLDDDMTPIDYSTLQVKKTFHGTGNYPQLVATEYWAHSGCDGHTEFFLNGYVYWKCPVIRLKDFDIPNLVAKAAHDFQYTHG